jgi:sigma-B regulation protein RsbU (phosphoserine phosphatase)
MKLSLRSRLFLLVGASVIFAAVPVIFFSRASLLENGMKKEQASFVNTVMLVEDELSVRYLHLLSSEVESVLEAKRDMRQTAELIREAIPFDTAERAAILKRWQQVLIESDLHLALFQPQGMMLFGDILLEKAMAEGQEDFKGQSMKSMLVGHKGRGSDGQFALLRIPDTSGEIPILVCLLPLTDGNTLILGTPVADMEASRHVLEKRMALGIQKRLEDLSLSPGASIAVIDSASQVRAGKGRYITLDQVPPDILERVRKGEILEGTTRGTEEDVLYRLAYVKAMDWYVVAAVPLKIITSPAEDLTRRLVMTASGLLVVGMLVTLLLTARIIAPLRMLTGKAGELAVRDFSREQAVLSEKLVEDLPLNRQDEIGQLAVAFAHMVGALDENIRKLKDTLAIQQRMEGELNAARDIQMGILPPPHGAPYCSEWSASAFLEPAKEVGGDLYDFFVAPDGRQAVVIGDVSDKGVSAALFMSMTVTLVRYALAEGLSCQEAMLRINERLAENNPSCMFVTLFIGLFDPVTGHLDYASGAHCPPFIVNPDPSIPVRALTDTSGPLVGAMEGMDYTACQAELAPGEYCLLYTDGVSEAMNETLELFGEERIAHTLDGLRNVSPEEVIQGVMEAVRIHRGTAAQSDDITMLCFQRLPRESEKSNRCEMLL